MARQLETLGVGYIEGSPRRSSSGKIRLGRATWVVGADPALGVAANIFYQSIPYIFIVTNNT
jgi:hypothetical protein